MTENRNNLAFVFDSAEPFGPELTANGLVASCPLYLPDTRNLTPETIDVVLFKELN
jgi:hypothetical protein